MGGEGGVDDDDGGKSNDYLYVFHGRSSYRGISFSHHLFTRVSGQNMYLDILQTRPPLPAPPPPAGLGWAGLSLEGGRAKVYDSHKL